MGSHMSYRILTAVILLLGLFHQHAPRTVTATSSPYGEGLTDSSAITEESTSTSGLSDITEESSPTSSESTTTGEPSSTGYFSSSTADTSSTGGSSSSTPVPSSTTPDSSSPTSGSSPSTTVPSSTTPDSSLPTSGSSPSTNVPSSSTPDSSSPTSGSSTSTNVPSTSTPDSSSPTSDPSISTTTPQSMTENQILEEIKKELMSIESILLELRNFINSFTTLIPPTTTMESTSTPVPAAAQNLNKKLLRVARATGDFCTPVNQGDVNDLCYQLTYLMDSIQNFTIKFISDNDITLEDLEDIRGQAQHLNVVVTEVKKDTNFVTNYKVDVQVFNARVDDVTQRVTNAIDEADNKIAENNDNSLTDSEILVIVLGTISGVMVIALVVLGIYVIRNKSKQRKMKKQRKMNSALDPLQDIAEGGYDNRALVDEESFSRGPDREPPVGRDPRSFAEDRNMPRSPATEAAGFRDPRQEQPTVILPRVGSPTRWSTAEGSKPTSPTGSFKNPSGTPRREGRRNEHPKNQYGHPAQPSPHSRPAYDADDNDPYSLEGRGANVRRVTSGGMRRVEQY